MVFPHEIRLYLISFPIFYNNRLGGGLWCARVTTVIGMFSVCRREEAEMTDSVTSCDCSGIVTGGNECRSRVLPGKTPF